MSGQLKEVRERITSVISTQQITKAMKMVSAAKLRRAQDAITDMRPYADRLDHMLKNILSNMDGDASTSFGTVRDIQKVCIVVVTSDRGLCGAFNTNVNKEAAKLIEKYDDVRKSGGMTLVFVGKKGYDYAKTRYTDCTFVTDFQHTMLNPDFEHTSKVSTYLMEGFENGDFDRIDVCYSKFKNAAIQFAKGVQYLPVAPVEVKSTDKVEAKADYIFEPNKTTLLDQLIPSILQTTFRKFVLDTNASQHGARMTAMDKATENAEDMLKSLKINYNKARQEAITKELSEIVGGAAALGG